MKVSKVLTWNDCGQGRSHQAGVHLPKDLGRSLFGKVGESQKNPKITLSLAPFGAGANMSAVVTYYNSRKFGGTRDEFRITRISQFIRESRLRPGDSLILDFDPVTRVGTIDYLRGEDDGKT